jgi:hypothetical protein
MRLTPPAPKTFVISLLLAALALLQQLGLRLPIPEFWTLLAAFAVVVAGNLIKGI